jgi:muramidase (phage lysozyme)
MILANQRAFLALIAFAEGTDREPEPYRVCYGYRHAIISLADHPAVTGEWRGERLPEAMCRGAGLSPGCVSTAAGRYQLIKPTWLGIKKRLRLPDFEPESQDRAALYLVEQRGALEDVHAGRIQTAISKCRPEWASLPGAGYGQPERRIGALVAAYEKAGGNVWA